MLPKIILFLVGLATFTYGVWRLKKMQNHDKQSTVHIKYSFSSYGDVIGWLTFGIGLMLASAAV